MKDYNEGLYLDVPSLGMTFGGLGHVPYMLVLLGVSTIYQHLSKIEVLLHWEHSCMRSVAKFILLSRWKQLSLKFSDNVMTMNLEAFKHIFCSER